MSPKLGRGLHPLFQEGLSPHLTQSPGLRPTSMLSTILIHPVVSTINIGRKFGGLRPLFGEGRVGSPSNTKSAGPRPTSIPSGILIHAAIWPQQVWAENWWGLCPFGGGGAGSPSNTMWPGPRPTCSACQASSWSVQLFGHCARTSQTRQDRQRTDSIGWTVLQMVAQKHPRSKVPGCLQHCGVDGNGETQKAEEQSSKGREVGIIWERMFPPQQLEALGSTVSAVRSTVSLTLQFM